LYENGQKAFSFRGCPLADPPQGDLSSETARGSAPRFTLYAGAARSPWFALWQNHGSVQCNDKWWRCSSL